MALRAGQEVDAWCTRCKMDLLHRIVAVADNKPAKVECRTCYQVHNYRKPHSEQTSGPTSVSSVPRRVTARRVTSVEDSAPVVPPSGVHAHSYTMTEKYVAEQWIVHRNFGNGVVLREVGSDKIEVRFDSGIKTLVHNRTE